MRIKWRGLELPGRLERDESVCTDTYGRFFIEPFERGFGTTIGNALRRVLLSSLQGTAVRKVRIVSAPHEFYSIEGVLEDVTDIILNIKALVIAADLEDKEEVLHVRRDKAGEIRGKDLECPAGLEIINQDLLLCTLTADVRFDLELTVGSGRGFTLAEEHRDADPEVGVIPVDSNYSPVLRVRYHTEDTRVGKRTNYDRLILEVWTKGTITPQHAVVEAGKILRKHLNPFVSYLSMGDELARMGARSVTGPSPKMNDALLERLSQPISVLELSSRAGNCLESVKIDTVGKLVACNEDDLLGFRSFGKTSLNEVKRKLVEMGLSLGMKANNPYARDLPDFQAGVGVSSTPQGGMEVFTMEDD